jgi:hypothetical protein
MKPDDRPTATQFSCRCRRREPAAKRITRGSVKGAAVEVIS